MFPLTWGVDAAEKVLSCVLNWVFCSPSYVARLTTGAASSLGQICKQRGEHMEIGNVSRLSARPSGVAGWGEGRERGNWVFPYPNSEWQRGLQNACCSSPAPIFPAGLEILTGPVCTGLEWAKAGLVSQWLKYTQYKLKWFFKKYLFTLLCRFVIFFIFDFSL